MKNERYYLSIMSPEEKQVYKIIYYGLKKREYMIIVPVNVTAPVVQEVYLRVLFDGPLFYYVNQTVIRMQGIPGQWILMPEYLYTANEILRIDAELKKVVEKVKKKADQFINNPFRLEKCLHDSVVKSVAYDYDCLSYYIGRECTMREILNTVLAVSKALEAIHSKGYTHFDVKPENIMMVKGKTRLADFSHCAQFLPDQIYNRPMGTGIYMAPEIMVDGKFTGKEDIYSLGISMYTLLMAGRLPFDFSKRESQKRERSDTIDSLFIHPELLEIIRRAAAFDASDRYEGFNEFSSAINEFINTHSEKVDEEMPLYRINPSLQQTVFPPSSHITWDDLWSDNNQSPNSQNLQV